MHVRTAFTTLALALSVGGCTTLKLSDFEPLGKVTAAGCTGPTALAFRVPASLVHGAFSADGVTREDSDFNSYSGALLSHAKASMPQSLQGDPVVEALARLMIKATAEAQVEAHPNDPNYSVQRKKVLAYSVPSRVSPTQMRAFAVAMMKSQVNQPLYDTSVGGARSRTIIQPLGVTGGGSPTESAAAAYFQAFYEGKYFDRFGANTKKPQLSATITDAQITAAFSVLVDYLVDLTDPTPVLGDKGPDGADAPAGTKFYPGPTDKDPTGAFADKPTALSAKLATYHQLPSGTCGWTKDNIHFLKDISDAAGDQAAAVGGLVTQTSGGFTAGIAVLNLKISIGDNQTLSLMAKTAATRLASRVAFAAGYYSIPH